MNIASRTCTLAVALFVAAVAFAVAASPVAVMAQTTSQSAMSSESTIRALQEALNKQGIAVALDGTLSEATRAAIRKYQAEHHLPVTGEPDSATLDKLGIAGQRTETPGATPSTGQSAPAAVMGPQMMQSMPQGMMGQGMMGPGMGPGMMGGMAGQAAPMGPGMGPGMTGTSQMPMMGGMPMQGMAMCPMMAGMMGMQPGAMPGRMGPQMGQQGIGPNLLYGKPSAQLSTDQVRAMLEQALAAHANPRLAVGDISEKDETTIIAEIVTTDGSLVQRLAFNRYPGLARQLP